MIFYPKTGTLHGGFIDFRYGGADSYTSRIVDDENNLTLYAKAKNVLLRTDEANQAKLNKAPTIPTNDQTSLAIATCGYVNRAVAAAAPDTSKFVTIDTTQTITGQKTFSAVNTYTGNLNTNGTYTVTGKLTQGSDAVGFSILEGGTLTLRRAYPILYFTNGTYTANLQQSGSTFHVRNPSGEIRLTAGGGDLVQLAYHPSNSDNTGSLAVATVGWCNSRFGKVKSVNGVGPDINGNVQVNIDMSDYLTKTEFNTTLQDYSTSQEIYDQYYTYQEVDDMFAKKTDLTSYVKSVDGHTPDASGSVSFNL